MKQFPSLSLQRLPLHVYISIFIILITIFVTVFLCCTSYLAARDEIVAVNGMMIRSTEQNAIHSQRLVDNGLRLYDDTYNKELRKRFPQFLDAYERAGRDPYRVDVYRLKEEAEPVPGGELGFHIINKSGVVIVTTSPQVLYLDFRAWPDYYATLMKGLAGEEFFADRITPAVASTESGRVTGELAKWGYMPTPDHEYLLEIGLTSTAFSDERTHLSAYEAAEDLKTFNPNLAAVRVCNSGRNLVTPTGVNESFTMDEALSRRLDAAFAGEDIWINSTATGMKTHYLLVRMDNDAMETSMDLVLELVYSDENLNRNLSAMVLYYLGIGALALLAGILLSVVVSRHITRPIAEIIDDTGRIAAGELDHPLRPLENPEFRHLQESITLMIGKIRHYSSEIEKEKTELQIASDIQQDLLPATLLQPAHLSIAAKNIPAKGVGGDFYDVIALPDPAGTGNRTAVLIADVSGKGMPAALFMALSLTVVRVLSVRYPSATGTMTAANAIISTNSRSGMFVTLFYGVISSDQLTISFVNAGHNPPMIFRAVTGTVEELPGTGPALGAVEDFAYGLDSASLAAGDLLFLYTDGVTEAINEREEMYGTDRLVAVVNRERTRPARDIVDAVIADVLAFAGSATQYDDITLMVIRVE